MIKRNGELYIRKIDKSLEIYHLFAATNTEALLFIGNNLQHTVKTVLVGFDVNRHMQ